LNADRAPQLRALVGRLAWVAAKLVGAMPEYSPERELTMNYVKFTRITAFSVVFLIILILPNPYYSSSRAQNESSKSTLEGTEWRFVTDAAYFLVEASYNFERQGRVTVVVITRDFAHDPQKPAVDAQVGTYTQEGNTVHLEFTDSYINATVKGSVMEGEMIGKNQAHERLKFRVTRTSEDNKERVSGGSAVADLSEPPGSAPKLRSGTFKGDTIETVDDGQLSEETSGIISVTIRSVESNSVNADVTLPGLTGEMSGEIVDKGMLRLTGVLTLSEITSKAKFRCSLTAFIKGRTLTGGKYHCAYGSGQSKGTFEAALSDQ
jgi:hypothetical protein